MTRGLSKSRLLAFQQCPKRLWLEVHEPLQVPASRETEHRFEVGHDVGRLARDAYARGVLIDTGTDWNGALKATTAALGRTPRQPVFEATFRAAGLLVRADILEPRRNGYDLIEVKSTGRVKDYHLPDAAIQTWVIRQAGLSVRSTAIRHLDTAFVYPGEGHYAGLFTTAPVDEEVAPLQAEIPKWIAAAQAVLAGAEPRITTGEQCTTPFECPFLARCAAQEPAGPEYPVTLLPDRKGKALARRLEAAGYASLADVPPREVAADPLFARIHAASRSGRPFLDRAGARAALKAWPFPRYYFDFETIAFAVPRWAGTRPYQQVPFQWSCHIDRGRGRVETRGFLDTSGENPATRCAEAMLATLGDAGPIVTYYAQFEKSVITTLAELVPKRRRPLLALRERVVDLLPVVRDHYYHPAMMGSFSIKAVLPTIAPELDYGDLEEVQDGGAAGLAYLEAIAPGTSPARKATLEQALERYCARDTEAMVRVAARLAG